MSDTADSFRYFFEAGGRGQGKTYQQHKERMKREAEGQTAKTFTAEDMRQPIAYMGITPDDDYLHNDQWLTMLRSFNPQQQQNILLAWRKERRRIRLKNICQLWPTTIIHPLNPYP